MIRRLSIALLLLSRLTFGTALDVCGPADAGVTRLPFYDLRRVYNPYLVLIPTDVESYHYGAVRTRQMPGHLFFEVECAILKELNDTIFGGDQTKTEQLVLLYKSLFFRELRNHSVLAPLVSHRFADYKGIRLVFSRDTAPVRDALRALHSRVNRLFAEEIERHPQVAQHFSSEQAQGLVRDPRNWFMAGIARQNGPRGNANAGQLADTASLAARFARSESGPGLDHFIDFNDRHALRAMSHELNRIEHQRRAIEEHILALGPQARDSGILVRASSGGYVLSARALDIFRQARHQPSRDAYVTYILERFERRFNVRLPRGWITGEGTGRGSMAGSVNFQDYYNGINRYNLSLTVVHDTVESPQTAPQGRLAFDFENQGGINQEGVAHALAEAAQVPLPHEWTLPGSDEEFVNSRARVLFSVRRARTSVDNAVANFFQRRDALVRTLEGRGIRGFDSTEGDTLYFAPSSPLSASQIREAQRQIERQNLAVRASFVAPHYEGTTARLPNHFISELEGRGWDAIKKVKLSVEGFRGLANGQIRPQVLESLRFQVNLSISPGNRSGTATVFISGNADRATRDLLIRRFQEEFSQGIPPLRVVLGES